MGTNGLQTVNMGTNGLQTVNMGTNDCVPFTVFTKQHFSLAGSFSSNRTPWKMRPNVPVKEEHIFD